MKMSKQYILFVLVVVQFIIIINGKKYKVEKYIYPYNITKCAMNDNLDMRVTNIKKTYQGNGKIFINTELSVKKTIKQFFGSIKVERCTEADVLQSCEHFLKTGNETMCSGHFAKIVQTQFFDLYSPKLGCPTKPGNYTMDDTTDIDHALSVLSSFITPDPKYFWRITTRIMDGNMKLVFCMKYILRVSEKRVKAK